MVSVWLIVLAVVVPILCLALNYYLLVYYQHPDDKNDAYFPKFVVVIGLTIAMLTVLLVPFDVANQTTQFGCGVWTNSCGDLSLAWVWQILFLIIGLLVLIVIPCTIFFYESFDYKNKTCKSACSSALLSQITIVIVFIAVFIGCFFGLNQTELPIQNFQASVFVTCPTGGCVPSFTPPSFVEDFQSQVVAFGTPILVFLPAFLGFVGWFIFSIYVGVGLIALPMDLIRAFIYRPKYMPKDLYEHTKLEIQKRTLELLGVGQAIRKEAELSDLETTLSDKMNPSKIIRRRKEGRLYNEFKKQVLEVEEDFSDLKLCHENWTGYNPFIPFFKLAAGIVAAIISLLWILQIILYNLARTPYGPDGIPASYFLNVMFSWASKEISFALFGTVLIGLFSMQLLFCVMKGNEKVGLRFFIVEIHPMKFGATYMNSFMVNTSLILLCIAPLVQFVSSSLREYVVLTDVDAIFGQQITYIGFFKYFFMNNVFVIIMISIAFITFVVMLWCPNDKNMKQSQSLSRKVEQFQKSMPAGPASRMVSLNSNSNAASSALEDTSIAHI